jgi:hypothetical protein
MLIRGREFLKDGRMTGAFQNPVSPDVPTHQGDRIGEGQRLFEASRPADGRFVRLQVCFVRKVEVLFK